MKQNETKNMQKYSCELCHYSCCKKSLWTQHINTKKHQMKQNETKNMLFSDKKHISMTQDAHLTCCHCAKKFNSRTTLWRHKKKCEPIIQANDDNPLILALLNENKKLLEAVKELSSKVGNNNNNNHYNTQVFLNDKCKDALNINDFINSLKISVEDLNITKEKGIIEGISSMVLAALKQLDIYHRPFHCTDLKRDVLYIKIMHGRKMSKMLKLKTLSSKSPASK